MTRRALHYVFKIGDRSASYKFYTEILGMKVLRHEEFDEGCKATCNGPYDGKWSKTMIGYGPEDRHFVLELTYNYGIGSYKKGNDFEGIWIKSKKAAERARKRGLVLESKDGCEVVADPDGHNFHLIAEDEPTTSDPIQKVLINVKKLTGSTDFWHKLCGMKVYHRTGLDTALGFADDQCKLQLRQLSTDVSLERGSAFGRIAFSCPSSELHQIENRVKQNGWKVLTPLISLDTPGKAAVQVVILADPNDHEICFVGDEGFRELSQVDPAADSLLKDAISLDDSSQWFSNCGGKPVG